MKTRPLAALLCWIGLLLLSPAGVVAAVQASWEGAVAMASRAGGEAVLTLPSGARVPLPLARDAALTSLALLGSGERWILAGDRPSAIDGVGRELVILRGEGERVVEIPAPGWQDGRMRQGAVLLTEGERLAGMVWLEGAGSRSFAVQAAPWNEATGATVREAGWGAPVTVAAPGPGSQLALTGAVLADGSWLVAWSAFDGTDDEILWSRRLAGTESWSAPRRLGADNAVPDITPALVATEGGALAVWSRYDDGQYRLFRARFAGDGFAAPEALAESGTMHPAFLRLGPDPEALTLLYLHAQPRSWGVMAVGADGTPGVPVLVPIATAAERQRPVLRRFDDGVLHLTWPEGDPATDTVKGVGADAGGAR